MYSILKNLFVYFILQILFPFLCPPSYCSTSQTSISTWMPLPQHTQHLTSKLPGASSLLRVRWIISEWTQTQKSSAVYVLVASYQLVYAACLVVQCLWDHRGPDWDCWSSYRVAIFLSFFQSFPNSTKGVRCFCPLFGCNYLPLTLSTACWVFQRAVMIGPFLWALHSLSNSVRPWDLSRLHVF